MAFFQNTAILAQAQSAPTAPTPAKLPPSSWTYSGALAIALVGVILYCKVQLHKKDKALKLERYKNEDLQKRLHQAQEEIKRLENSEELIQTRDFLLDYLKRRLREEVFYSMTLSQIRGRVKQLVSKAVLPETKALGGVSGGRLVEDTFDIIHEIEIRGKLRKRSLFRVFVQLVKMPKQQHAAIMKELIECFETFLSTGGADETWQPLVQNRLTSINWNWETKPTPLLILRQSDEGLTRSYGTKLDAANKTPPGKDSLMTRLSTLC
ncbi:MAG: hypothetical protein HC890_19075 [Chloroflexaceae bacterium]|nr:hypothetical protein [Chloroflexaceae bacterium]